ncbi:hypothetical protein A2757_02860 [Candidatus Giovannonibacteria bacterium RIFCSPHIGHO2_01_FULL_48_47]|nr:MAG: hypothetical protein A2757_02860 [Candidatus Giovannonibacteria bacterium RIFCSPHIGHO2_01_FULL_48_47]OGF68474.1 MAG: hypothetical protein A3D61_00300 [Candidatus Giovannonibacteria bacterium RIFCSPHIGHO2_02_FULL_48_15]OGF88676.1 MAG: hypothetical protein A3B26_03485 [Candidatus Giovannonibacteria bacterium RIFCSPLOWO2_01_FULL_48_47]OGF94596.1 MAG: hypothetical protein A2433_03250 [Candidatus Giovannonibacteria bacterium RIFOXYC1_FULL_48_8]OGF95927.1 MAG: hypothetical protein A2613_03890
MKYFFKPAALKDLKKLPRIVQRRIITKFDFYTAAIDPLKFSEELKDPRLGERRFHIGDYRALFDVERDRIIILKVGHRKDIYK